MGSLPPGSTAPLSSASNHHPAQDLWNLRKLTQLAIPRRYKWTDNALHTTIVAPGVNVTVGGATVPVRPFPQSSTGVAGVLIGDPCINDASILSLVACFYGKKFQTATRTPALLNAFVGNQSAMDFWGLLGDNFYDRTGEATKKMFSAISQETKAKPFLTVPGNHDYWVSRID